MANITRKGRTRTPPFVMLDHRLLDSAAWQRLGFAAAKLLLLLARRHNGTNNGQIQLGEREAAEAIGAARNTVRTAFLELEQSGFIVATDRGHFNVKIRVATTWRLTFHATAGAPATHDYRDQPSA